MRITHINVVMATYQPAECYVTPTEMREAADWMEGILATDPNALFEWESCYIGCYIEVERWNTLEALQTPSNAAPPHGASILPSRVRARLFIASNYRLVVFDSL